MNLLTKSICLSSRNANHGIIHFNSSRFKRDDRDLEEEEENWFDKDDDEDISSAVSPQSDEILKGAKHNDIDMIDNIRRTPNSSVTALSSTNSSQLQVAKKMTDSPTKTTPLTSMTSVAPSVNSRKVTVFYAVFSLHLCLFVYFNNFRYYYYSFGRKLAFLEKSWLSISAFSEYIVICASYIFERRYTCKE